jgi:hypothetical protein
MASMSIKIRMGSDTYAYTVGSTFWIRGFAGSRRQTLTSNAHRRFPRISSVSPRKIKAVKALLYPNSHYFVLGLAGNPSPYATLSLRTFTNFKPEAEVHAMGMARIDRAVRYELVTKSGN